MKKHKTLSKLLIAVIGLSVIILIMVFYLRLHSVKITVLSSEIDSVVLTANPPNQTVDLKEEQIHELVDLLNNLTLMETDDSYQEYTGQWLQFDIKKTDGTFLSIAELGFFVIIDGNCYKISNKQSGSLNDFANGILESFKNIIQSYDINKRSVYSVAHHSKSLNYNHQFYH